MTRLLKIRLVALATLLLAAGWISAFAGQLPKSDNKLVNDYADVLTERQRTRLENRLVAFSDSTSNQIVIILTPSLEGYEIMDYARRIGDSWGVGQSDFKNGLVIVVKVRNETDGEVAIATGYGLEGALPDIACSHIINDVMVPRFAEKEYYNGLVEALEVIEPIAAGEYTYADYQRRQRNELRIGMIICALLFAGVVIFLVIVGKRNNGKGSSNGENLNWDYDDESPSSPFFRARHAGWGMGAGGLGGLGGHGGGFGSGGGFGGFGGGSFGGGGAHGKF